MTVSDELSDIADFFINITISFLRHKFGTNKLFTVMSVYRWVRGAAASASLSLFLGARMYEFTEI